jgi:hypothetical protein
MIVVLMALVILGIFFSSMISHFFFQSRAEGTMQGIADITDIRNYFLATFDCGQTASAALTCSPSGNNIQILKSDGSVLIDTPNAGTYTTFGIDPKYNVQATCLSCSGVGCSNGKRILIQIAKSQNGALSTPMNSQSSGWVDLMKGAPVPCVVQ